VQLGEYSRFFFSPPGTPASARALPPGVADQQLRTFQVMKPFEVHFGSVAPAFGQFGLGTQFRSSTQLGDLLGQGFLKEIKP
jgi:Tuberculosis necrotizing toxin